LNKNLLKILLIIGLALAIFFLRKWQRKETPTKPKTATDKPKDPSSIVNRDRGFDRRVSYLKYSKHANCRMECRKITLAEVEEVMKEGKINYTKSDLKNGRCPRYAVESTTDDDQRVRIVFAQCNDSTIVVTVIDLETEFECNCPGDNSGRSAVDQLSQIITGA
jgi:hypothetical protein